MWSTILGLYSNVSGELDNTDRGERTQRDWLTEELATAPRDKFLLVAVHHPIYSLGKHGGTLRVREAIEKAIAVSGRWPDAILTGHDHCYQRFTLMRHGRQIPVLGVGAGGYAGYDDLTRVRTQLETPAHVKLEAHNDRRPGFMRLTATSKFLTGEYFTVPKPGCERKPAKARDIFTLSS